MRHPPYFTSAYNLPDSGLAETMSVAPNIKEPVALIRPSVYYKYAGPGLEACSIGQRILMRIGSRNETIMKGKLREIREELKLHMREKKAEGAGWSAEPCPVEQGAQFHDNARPLPSRRIHVLSSGYSL